MQLGPCCAATQHQLASYVTLTTCLKVFETNALCMLLLHAFFADSHPETIVNAD